MLNGIQGMSPYYLNYSGNYGSQAAPVRAVQGTAPGAAQPAAGNSPGISAGAVSAGRGYRMVQADEGASDVAGSATQALLNRRGVDPAEYAVRMRIQYVEPEAAALPGQEKAQGAEGPEAVDDGECQTCERRKYQDGSNDMGVSFKTPTRIAPEAAGAAVRSHEQEHVSRERAKAEREDRRVVSQSVTLHTDICPECGRVYISGGTTQTTTAAKPEPAEAVKPEAAQRRPFSAVA